MSLAAQLTDYINAAFSGLWVQTHEPDEAEREILRLARDRKWKIAVWDVASGLHIARQQRRRRVRRRRSAWPPCGRCRPSPSVGTPRS